MSVNFAGAGSGSSGWHARAHRRRRGGGQDRPSRDVLLRHRIEADALDLGLQESREAGASAGRPQRATAEQSGAEGLTLTQELCRAAVASRARTRLATSASSPTSAPTRGTVGTHACRELAITLRGRGPSRTRERTPQRKKGKGSASSSCGRPRPRPRLLALSPPLQMALRPIHGGRLRGKRTLDLRDLHRAQAEIARATVCSAGRARAGTRSGRAGGRDIVGLGRGREGRAAKAQAETTHQP